MMKCLLFYVGISILSSQVMGQSNCDAIVTIPSGGKGNITSPNYPKPYPKNTDCTYKLIGETSSDIITITIYYFKLEKHRSCNFDYLEVHDGPSIQSNLIGERLCGSQRNGYRVTGSGKYLTLHFHADESNQHEGFLIQYKAECRFDLTQEDDQIASPGYPNNYPPGSKCIYSIQPATGNQILLTFSYFQLETSSQCNFDYVTLSVGENNLGRYCGDRTGSRRLVNSSKLTLTFQSDRSLQRPGFQINYHVTTNCQVSNGGCSQSCREASAGVVVCSCQPGFIIGDDGVSCEDVDECANNPCGDVCHNTQGSYSCSCSTSGFILSPDNITCTDMTCKINNGGCEHVCQPYGVAQYICACHPGFILSSDAHNCTDINECNTTNVKYTHSCEQQCVNEPGSYHCLCDDGYQVSSNRRSCDDVDECSNYGQECTHFCQNIPGGWECACYPGYEVDPDHENDCMDVDECARGTYPQTCLTCDNSEGSYDCTCRAGFEPNDSNTNCTDIDECLLNNGGCNQVCLNHPGSFQCTCKVGYTNQSNICTDINECAANEQRGPCSHYCENHEGFFECHCPQGFKLLEDKLTCEDVNECEIKKNGGCLQECNNVPGSFKCSCYDGYLDVNGTCNDVDECRENPCDQSVDSKCSNTEGGFKCDCPTGYYVNVTQCIDIDECAKEDHGCQQECRNTVGSFGCECSKGYKMERNECLDIDECNDVDTCGQLCNNLPGSFWCDCNSGYYLLGDQRNCSDTNECTLGLHDCNQVCINEIGFHRCECNLGFELRNDNVTCSDINECSLGSSGCSHDCLNTEGSFICYCPSGFVIDSADNRTCIDRNECLVNNGGCDHFCINTNGSFSCNCQDGFQFNGTTGCSDIDECATSNGNCSQQCINHEGSYECQCDPNYKLAKDQHNCTHCPTCAEFEAVQSDVEVLKALMTRVDRLIESNVRLNAMVVSLEERVRSIEQP